MNLRDNQITVGEILDYPPALAVLRRRFGFWMNHPKVASNRSLTLAQLIQKTGAFVSPQVIQETLAELKKL